MESHQNKIILIVGPTAVGKTHLSLILAQKLKTEIVSADSRQIYKFMDIGTAKPSLKERQHVQHHFIDIKYPDEYYSAGRYGRDARIVINKILSAGKLPIVVGGSGLYIKALVDGFFETEISDISIKQKLMLQAKKQGLNELYNRLATVDPTLAERTSPNDSQRIIRGLEVWEVTGIPLSKYQQEEKQRANFDPIFIGLAVDRQHLYRRIEDRVDEMIQRGLVAEVLKLIKMGYSEALVSLKSVGYKEVFEYIKGTTSFDDMVQLIKQRSRNYAKRQLTWFRREKRIIWFDINDTPELDKIVIRVETLIKNK